jgi:hypothetical protein
MYSELTVTYPQLKETTFKLVGFIRKRQGYTSGHMSAVLDMIFPAVSIIEKMNFGRTAKYLFLVSGFENVETKAIVK